VTGLQEQAGVNQVPTVRIAKQSDLFRSQRSQPALDLHTDRKVVVEASAGTGKTFAIIELVLELVLEAGVPLREILLVTFTEKATNELRERLRSRLRELLHQRESGMSDELEADQPHWVLDDVHAEELQRALLDFDAIAIHTIHGFCLSVLREFAFENRQLFTQQQTPAHEYLPDLLEALLRQHLLQSHTALGRMFQQVVKRTGLRPAKLLEEVAELQKHPDRLIPEFPDWETLLAEFEPLWKRLRESNGKLAESAEAITNGEQPPATDIQTHPVRIAYEQLNLDRRSSKKMFEALDSLTNLLALVRKGLSLDEVLGRAMGIDLGKVINPALRANSTFDVSETVAEWRTAVEALHILLTEAGLAGAEDKHWKAWLLKSVVGQFRLDLQAHKEEAAIYDYDDMLTRVQAQLRPDAPGAATLRNALRTRYRCAVVDEFQDTDPVQWPIFRELFLEAPEHRLVVIGDPKQAIYGFRRADLETYRQARKELLEQSGRSAPFTLGKNFRSSAALLEGVNQIFGRPEFFENAGGGEADIVYQNLACGNPEIALAPTDGNSASPIRLLVPEPRFRLQSKDFGTSKKALPSELQEPLAPLRNRTIYGEAEFVQQVRAHLPDPEDEPAVQSVLKQALNPKVAFAEKQLRGACAQEIRRLLHDPPTWFDKEAETVRPLNAGDIAVLCRKRKEADAIAATFRQHGILHTVYKQSGLFQTRAAREILAFLQALEQPEGWSRMQQAWLTNFFGARLETLEAQRSLGAGHPLRRQFLEWQELAQQRRYRRLFSALLKFTQVVERDLLHHPAEREATNRLHLIQHLIQDGLAQHLDLPELIQSLQRCINAPETAGDANTLRLDSEQEAVQVMTIHAAKGLEFPVVFVCGGLTGPHPQRTQRFHGEGGAVVIDLLKTSKEAVEQEEQAENERMLYVALTRAGGRLYLPAFPRLEHCPDLRVSKLSEGAPLSLLQEALDEMGSTGHETGFVVSARPELVTGRGQGLRQAQPERSRPTGEVGADQTHEPAAHSMPPFSSSLFWGLKAQHRGLVATSFSRLNRQDKKAEGSIHESAQKPTQTMLPDQMEEAKESDEVALREPLRPQAVPEPLPGGANTGTYLHELLELVEFEGVKRAAGFEEWSERTQTLFQSVSERHGVDEAGREQALSLVWHSLTRPVPIPARGKPLRIVDCSRKLPELAFHLPIPEAQHPKLGTHDSSKPWQIERGYLQGSIDLLFEHEEPESPESKRIFLVDWKSNRLDNYEAETLAETVRNHYALQVEIYTLATAHWLGIQTAEEWEQRFGGVLYVFLRGMPHGPAVDFQQPTWAQVQRIRDTLQEREY